MLHPYQLIVWAVITAVIALAVAWRRDWQYRQLMTQTWSGSLWIDYHGDEPLTKIQRPPFGDRPGNVWWHVKPTSLKDVVGITLHDIMPGHLPQIDVELLPWVGGRHKVAFRLKYDATEGTLHCEFVPPPQVGEGGHYSVIITDANGRHHQHFITNT